MNIAKTAEGFLFSLGVLLFMLIALYGLSHLIIRYSPQPLSGVVQNIVDRSTPSGWTGTSNS